jgi:hypothetical protein
VLLDTTDLGIGDAVAMASALVAGRLNPA